MSSAAAVMGGGRRGSVAAPLRAERALLCFLFLTALFGLASSATLRGHDDISYQFTSPGAVHMLPDDTFVLDSGMPRSAGLDGMVIIDVPPGQADTFRLNHWRHMIKAAEQAAGTASAPMVGVGNFDTELRKGTPTRFNDLPVLSASRVIDATRAAAAAATDNSYHVASALYSDQLFHRIPEIQSSTTNSLVALTMMVAMLIDLAGKTKRSGGRRGSPAALLMLLAVAALLSPAMAARPLHGGGRGHGEAAAAGPVAAAPAATVVTMLNDAAAGRSSCTNDQNTQVPVRCVPPH